MAARIIQVFIWGMTALLFSFMAMVGSSAAESTKWHQAPPLRLARSSACTVHVKDHLYVVGGGWLDAFTPLTSVEVADFLPDGRLTAWSLTSRMTTPRVFLSCVELNGFLYAIGGERFKNLQPVLLNSVERAQILPDGHLGRWEPAAPLTTPRRAPVAFAVHDGIYVIGGYNGTFLRSIEHARLLPDGRLGEWKVIESKTVIPRYIHTGVRINDTLYLLGGHDESTGMANNRTEWTRIQPNGELGQWREGPVLLTNRFLSAAISFGKRIYLLGGSTGPRNLDTMEMIGIMPDGSLGTSRPGGNLDQPRSGLAVARQGERVYVIGGLNHGQALSTVMYTTFAP